MTVRIAVDCMGGDGALTVTVPASVAFLQSQVDAELLLVGRSEEIHRALASIREDKSRLVVEHASEVIEMHDPPVVALRRKPDSSMRVAVELVKHGRADACVSSGNTGALLAVSRSVLKNLPGIARPAIAAQIPNQKGSGTTVLDLGANVDCSAGDYLQFAIMGVALVSALYGKASPSVGLLNIGEESIKGSDVVKKAAEFLRASQLNFYGNVEGNALFEGTTDVVVCDGFVGNVALKASEGLSDMVLGIVKEECQQTFFSRLRASVAKPILRRIRGRLDARRYNGAVLLGLRGIVLKSHGAADVVGFEWALRRAFDIAKNGLSGRIEQTLAGMQCPTAGEAGALDREVPENSKSNGALRDGSWPFLTSSPEGF